MQRQMRLHRWRRICISKSYKELLYEKNRERRKPLLWYTLLFIFLIQMMDFAKVSGIGGQMINVIKDFVTRHTGRVCRIFFNIKHDFKIMTGIQDFMTDDVFIVLFIFFRGVSINK